MVFDSGRASLCFTLFTSRYDFFSKIGYPGDRFLLCRLSKHLFLMRFERKTARNGLEYKALDLVERIGLRETAEERIDDCISV